MVEIDSMFAVILFTKQKEVHKVSHRQNATFVEEPHVPGGQAKSSIPKIESLWIQVSKPKCS